MDESWNIIYYQNQTQRQSPVYEFINNLDSHTKSKIIGVFNLLESYGIRLGLPHSKKIQSTPLWELRIVGEDNIRIFYVAITGKNFLLLHGFNKKKQKTDKKEIEVALVRLREYNSCLKS